MRHWLRIGLFVVLAAGIGFAAADKEEYSKAVPFTLPDIEGNEITLDSLLATGPVYMECWDLPCVNCIAELDALKPVYDSLKDCGLQIVALSVDKPADEAKVKTFVKTKKWPYIVLLDQQQKVKSAYKIVIKPTAYLVNTDGKIVYTHVGYKKGDEKRIAGEFKKWLPEKGPGCENCPKAGAEKSGADQPKTEGNE